MTQNNSESLIQIGQRLLQASHIRITSHQNGDGDSVGSSIALALALKAQGKSVRVVLADYPSKYEFLNREIDLVVPQDEGGLDRALDGAELGILLDASQTSRVGDLESAFFAKKFPVLCIDHHLGEPSPDFELTHVDSSKPSTGSLILNLLDHMGIELDISIARALFVAIATDTGWFRFSNTDSEVLQDASRLLRFDLQPDRLYQMIYEQLSLARTRLQGDVIHKMEAEFDGRFIWSYVDLGMLESSGIRRDEFEGLIDALRSVEGAEVAALVTQLDSLKWKVSFRSQGAVNVQEIASRLGGGGHAKAAGGGLAGTFEEARQKLLSEVQAQLDKDL